MRFTPNRSRSTPSRWNSSTRSSSARLHRHSTSPAWSLSCSAPKRDGPRYKANAKCWSRQSPSCSIWRLQPSRSSRSTISRWPHSPSRKRFRLRYWSAGRISPRWNAEWRKLTARLVLRGPRFTPMSRFGSAAGLKMRPSVSSHSRIVSGPTGQACRCRFSKAGIVARNCSNPGLPIARRRIDIDRRCSMRFARSRTI